MTWAFPSWRTNKVFSRLNCLLVWIRSHDYSLLYHNLYFGESKFEVRSTSLAPLPVLHPGPGASCRNEAPPWPAEEERASCRGQAGWELGRPAVAQELLPLISTSFIWPTTPTPSPPPLSSLHPSSYPFFLSLPPSASRPALSPRWAPLCPVSCGRANGISLCLHPLPKDSRVLSAVVCLFLFLIHIHIYSTWNPHLLRALTATNLCFFFWIFFLEMFLFSLFLDACKFSSVTRNL